VQEEFEGEQGQRGRVVAGLDDGEAGTVTHEQPRGGTRAGNGDTHLLATIRGGAPQFAGNLARLTEEARQAADVEGNLARAAHVDARRKLASRLDQLRRVTARGCVKSAVHRGLTGRA
jgi:hypothetical protein